MKLTTVNKRAEELLEDAYTSKSQSRDNKEKDALNKFIIKLERALWELEKYESEKPKSRI